MKRWVLLPLAVLLAGCSHRLVKIDDLAEIKRTTAGTHVEVMTDLNQRIRNLEKSAADADTLLRELATRQKTANKTGAATKKIMDRIEDRLFGGFPTEAEDRP